MNGTHRQAQLVSAAARISLVYGAAFLLSSLAGIIAASGRPVLVALFAGLVFGAVLVSSREALLWFVIIGGIVVAGVAQLYFPDAKYVKYLIPAIAFGLPFHGIMDRLALPSTPGQGPTSPILLWALGFFVVAMLSTALNWDGAAAPIIGWKGYFQMWPFFLGFVLIQWRKELVWMLPRSMLYIGFLQLPFVYQQYHYLVPKRMGLGGTIVPVDVVSGTFGASLLGGGSNAVLAAFMMVLIGGLLGIWKHGALSTIRVVAFSLLLISPVFFNLAKISAVYLPLVFIIVFYEQIAVNPLRLLVAAGAMTGVLVALLTAFVMLQSSDKVQSINDLVEYTIERQTADTEERASSAYGELSRWTALTFWAKEHASANIMYTLVGHGPGASRVQENSTGLPTTLAEKRYGGLSIGYTAVSALLWDTGILGLGCVLGLFFSAFRAAGRLSQYYSAREERLKAGLFDGLRGGLAVLTLSLAHKDFFAFNLPYQTFVLLVIGFLVVNQRAVVETPAEG